MKQESYYQSETIAYGTGTTASTYYKEITLNSSYERCVGIAVIESKDAALSSYRIGVADKDKQYISSVHKDMLRSHPTAGLSNKERFLPVNIKANGHKIKISTTLPVQLTADLEYDVVLLLERPEQQA